MALTAFIVINPLELQRRARDSVRVSDLATINQAIQSAVAEASGSASNILCVQTCGSYNSTQANAQKIDGTGWVTVNLTGNALKLSALPLDPVNTGTNSNNKPLEYVYDSDGTDWELNAALESTQYQSKMVEGGNNDNLLEVGTNLNLLP